MGLFLEEGALPLPRDARGAPLPPPVTDTGMRGRSFGRRVIALSRTYAPLPLCLLALEDGKVPPHAEKEDRRGRARDTGAEPALPLGVDAEVPRLRALPSLYSWTARESRLLRDLERRAGAGAHAREVLRRWTVKEAVAKARGTGFDRRTRPDAMDTGSCGARRGLLRLENTFFAWRTLVLPGLVVSLATDAEHRDLLDNVRVLLVRGV